MRAGEGPWGWTYDVGFTLTLTFETAPDVVLANYRADLEEVRLLTRTEALRDVPPRPGGSQLRVGQVDSWTVCFEEFGTHGTRSDLMAALSFGSESFSYSAGYGMKLFQYYRAGRRIESFERGMPSTLRGEGPHRFWIATAENGGQPELAITSQTGISVPIEFLDGPMLTAWVGDPHIISNPPTAKMPNMTPLGGIAPPGQTPTTRPPAPGA
ncbi:DUF6461 domain-containing protein [Paractinoplanes hotanensis]|uniref:DUF6461 domain-containing protein n=1 Tax=Paractinoplanes hotanensis TaxID=2906497 RepID=A0ABT0YE61_9ACTN|nr:DUF6461 domain-containing protein [Actinoplanes hotanensis]MCM4084343.1 DUF6461 domain-containing protein [Actinoplanes hotanensis]